MSRVAIVTDSASDLTPEQAAAAGVSLVPLLVSFGDQEFQTNVDITVEEFYRRLLAPGAPFPKTAACSPGAFQSAVGEAFDRGADAAVVITVGGKLSATLKSAQIARDALSDKRIHVVDSDTASAPLGLLVLMAAEAAAAGESAEAIVAMVERRKPDAYLFVALETLEYLRRGGRISGAQAVIGSALSVKPILMIENGVVETSERPRTHKKARARLIELLTEKPVERIGVLHTQAPDVETFATDLAQAAGIPREQVTVDLMGPSVAPHVGPGAYGAGIIRKAG